MSLDGVHQVGKTPDGADVLVCSLAVGVNHEGAQGDEENNLE